MFHSTFCNKNLLIIVIRITHFAVLILGKYVQSQEKSHNQLSIKEI